MITMASDRIPFTRSSVSSRPAPWPLSARATASFDPHHDARPRRVGMAHEQHGAVPDEIGEREIDAIALEFRVALQRPELAEVAQAGPLSHPQHRERQG